MCTLIRVTVLALMRWLEIRPFHKETFGRTGFHMVVSAFMVLLPVYFYVTTILLQPGMDASLPALLALVYNRLAEGCLVFVSAQCGGGDTFDSSSASSTLALVQGNRHIFPSWTS